MVSLADVAKVAGVSVKTVSGALNGSAARMSGETRERIITIAAQMGYVVDAAARATRQGRLPIVGLVADGLITSPFATDIMRVFDNSLKARGLSVLVSNLQRATEITAEIHALRQFRPHAIVYASMFHKIITIPQEAEKNINLTVNCHASNSTIPAIVPDDKAAAFTITEALIVASRRRIAFINLPHLHAGDLREKGFRHAHQHHAVTLREDFIVPAVAGSLYHDRARSLVQTHLGSWFAGTQCPDAILCGNDRVALEVYNGLRRLQLNIPSDIAVASFDNQVELARRLDPPLTTMALPHRAMAHAAAEYIFNGGEKKHSRITRLPFTLIRRQSL